MNGCGRLIKNELIKITHQLSWKIITALVLVIAIAVPILNNLSVSTGSYSYEEWLEEQRDACDGVMREYYDAELRARHFFTDNNISIGDWRYAYYFGEYETNVVKLSGFECLLNDADPEEVWNIYWLGDDIEYDYDKGVYYYRNLEDDTLQELSDKLLGSLADETRDKITEIENTVTTITFDDYANMRIDMIVEDLGEAQASLEEAKLGGNSQMICTCEYALEGIELQLEAWRSAIGTSFEDESWVLNTLEACESVRNSFAAYVPMDESDFNADAEFLSTYRTYDAYKKYCDDAHTDCVGAMNTALYSIKNGIPMPDYMTSSARSEFESSVLTNVSLVLFFCMILAATIVASEHTSGTIRLLMIRPRARWKILFSKLAAVAIYGIVCFVAATALSLSVTAIIHGTEEFSVPILFTRGESVAKVSVFAAVFKNALIEALPMLVLVMLAFGLSVIMKKVVFAVAIPLMIQMFGSVASQLSWVLMPRFHALSWTIIPYFELSSLNVTPLERFTEYNYFDLNALGLTLEYGIFMMLLHIALALIISFVVWNKQQIKN